MLSRLTRISEEYNVAVFITNQVQADPVSINFIPLFHGFVVLTLVLYDIQGASSLFVSNCYILLRLRSF